MTTMTRDQAFETEQQGTLEGALKGFDESGYPDFPTIELDFGDGMDWRGLDDEPEADGEPTGNESAGSPSLVEVPVVDAAVASVTAVTGDPVATETTVVPVVQTELEKARDKIESLNESVTNQERAIADQQIQITELANDLKNARKYLKESTEDLIDLRGRLASARIAMSELIERGDTPVKVAGTSPAAGSDADAGSPSPAATPRVGGEAGQATATATAGSSTRRYTPEDPAITTDLWVLKFKIYEGGATNSQIEKLNGEDVRTIANLEEYIRGGLFVPGRVKGLGQAAVDKVSDALMAWRQVNPVPMECDVSDVPDDLVGVDEPATAVAAKLVEALVDEFVEAIVVPSVPATTSPAPVEEADPALAAAYTAGTSAASAMQPVSTNPHERGTALWMAWDRGWQECDNL